MNRSSLLVCILVFLIFNYVSAAHVQVNVNVGSEGEMRHPSHVHHNHEAHHEAQNNYAQINSADDDSSCPGVCGDPSSCTGTLKHNLCSGGSDNVCCIGGSSGPSNPSSPSSLSGLRSIVSGSSCARFNWSGRGNAPAGYTQGLALTFARAVCNPSRSDIVFVSSARTSGSEDVLNFYKSQFTAAGLSNEESGVNTLRHIYTLLFGLGMRESSGAYCCGRDLSSGFSSASSAEAGPFQTSYGSKASCSLLEPLFESWQNADTSKCNLAVWKQGASCPSHDAKNWGTGPGEEWQALTKACPTFAAEWAAALLRTSGGSKGEWGPLRTGAAQVRPECDSMLQQVQNAINANPSLCNEL